MNINVIKKIECFFNSLFARHSEKIKLVANVSSWLFFVIGSFVYFTWVYAKLPFDVKTLLMVQSDQSVDYWIAHFIPCVFEILLLALIGVAIGACAIRRKIPDNILSWLFFVIGSFVYFRWVHASLPFDIKTLFMARFDQNIDYHWITHFIPCVYEILLMALAGFVIGTCVIRRKIPDNILSWLFFALGSSVYFSWVDQSLPFHVKTLLMARFDPGSGFWTAVFIPCVFEIVLMALTAVAIGMCIIRKKKIAKTAAWCLIVPFIQPSFFLNVYAVMSIMH